MLTEGQLRNTPFICEITNEEYHAAPGLSNSGITLLLDCPKKYWDRYLNPDKAPREETASMKFGTEVHAFLLEPDEFFKRYCVAPKELLGDDGEEKTVRKNTNLWKEFEKEAAGRIIIWDEELDKLFRIRRSVNEHKTASLLLRNGKAEQSIFWLDKETDVLCKTRPDYLTKSYIVDIKKTKSAKQVNFEWSAGDYNYDQQAAMALDGFEAISGIQHNYFINLCIEPDRPYIVSPFLMRSEAIEAGREMYKRGLRIFKECQANNHWPQYVDDIVEISPKRRK